MNEHPEKENRLSRGKKAVYSLVLMAATVIVAILTSEIIFRFFFPQQEAMQWHLSSERYGFVMKKNFHQTYHYVGSGFSMEVETNSMGLRDKEYDSTKTGQKKVLLLGDSFTFGYGVEAEDNFDSKLENLLNSEGGRWEVINAGHGGWGTLQQSLYANDHLDLFKPDIIILTFCGNDPSDDLRFMQKRHDSEKGILHFPGKIFIRNHSHLYRFIFNAHKILSNRWTLEKKLATIEDVREVYVDKQSACAITAEDWKLALDHIRNLHHDFLEFNPEGIMLVQATAPLEQIIRNHLSSLSNHTNLFYVDLYDDVSQLDPDQMRLPYDGHWSPEMHTISAQNLYAAILALARRQDFSENP